MKLVLAFACVVLVGCADETNSTPAPPTDDAPPPGASAARPTSPTNDAPPEPGGDPQTSPDPASRPVCTAQIGKAVGDWSLFGNGQCLVAIQNFYPAKFGVSVPIARSAYTGACAPEGACHIWLDDIPDPAKWERIASDGTELPSTYDVIVFPPTAGNPYGHIASVDRVEGGVVYVMDANFNLDEKRASTPHAVSGAYGWYHLTSRPKTTWCSSIALPADIADQPCPVGDGLYCGGNAGLAGDPTLLYRCKGDEVTLAESCATTCAQQPSGEADRCQ